ncbi:MAG: DUF1178 family protein [Proteobacteria bacterium]|nr:DUF1178 family protein [Pseudomonadota bacterium]
MIVLNLICDAEHAFDGWFGSVDAFDTQQADGLVECPVCGNKKIARLPSGPRILRHGASSAAAEKAEPTRNPMAGVIQAWMEEAARSEDVAERFPDEARKIHYGEKPARPIRGRASTDQTLELLDEGIPVLPLPFPAKGEMH